MPYANLQVLAHLKRRREEKTLYFDEAFLSYLTSIAAARVQQIDRRIDALRDCPSKFAPQVIMGKPAIIGGPPLAPAIDARHSDPEKSDLEVDIDPRYRLIESTSPIISLCDVSTLN